ILTISIAFEQNLRRSLNVFLQNLFNGIYFVLFTFNGCIYFRFKLQELLTNNSIQYDDCTCTMVAGANSSELKFIPGKGEWGSSVSVGIVQQYFRYSIYIDGFLSCFALICCGFRIFKTVQYFS